MPRHSSSAQTHTANACEPLFLIIARLGQAASSTQLSRYGKVEPREIQDALPTDKKRITDSFGSQPPGDWEWAPVQGFVKKLIQSALCLTTEVGPEGARTILYPSKAPLSGKSYPAILNQWPSELYREEQGVILAQFPLASHSKRLDVVGAELTDRLTVRRLKFLKDCSPFSRSNDQDIMRRYKRMWADESVRWPGVETTPPPPANTYLLLCMKHCGGTLFDACKPCFPGLA